MSLTRPLVCLLCLVACGGDRQADTADASAKVDAGPGIPDADLSPPPVCSIAMNCTLAIPDEPKTPCDLRIEDGKGGIAYAGSAGVEKRGRSSQTFPKPQYSIELRVSATDVTEVPTNLLAMGRESDWVLNGAYIDRSLLRNKLLYDTFAELGGPERYAPQSAYCEMTLNGEYQGIYLLTERIKRDDDRVAIPADTALDGSSFLIKQDDADGFKDVETANGRWRLVYPNENTATAEQVAGVSQWLSGWNAVISGADTNTNLFTMVDLNSAVDFVLLEEFAKNNDAYFLSMHVWKAPGGLLHFSLWDLDLSFGQPDYNNSESPEEWVLYRPALITQMASQPEFKAQLSARWAELRTGLMSDAQVLDRLDFHVETIAEQVEQNFERWPITSIQFLGDKLYPVTSYEDELAKVRQWIVLRLAWMDANIDTY